MASQNLHDAYSHYMCYLIVLLAFLRYSSFSKLSWVIVRLTYIILHTSFKTYLQKNCIVQLVTLLNLVFALNLLDKMLFPRETMNKRIL